jgi:hypothetical protein
LPCTERSFSTWTLFALVLQVGEKGWSAYQSNARIFLTAKKK